MFILAPIVSFDILYILTHNTNHRYDTARRQKPQWKQMKTIDNILGKSSVLQNLLSKTKELQYLNKIFAFCLERNLAKHCRIAKIDTENRTLHVVVDNPTWATKLRYTIPDILKNLKTQPEFKNIKNISYSVIQVENQHLTPAKQNKIQIPFEIKQKWDKFYAELKANHIRSS